MTERTTVHAVFPDGRVATALFPVWLLPLPGDLVTIPGEEGPDGGLVPLTVNARLLQPDPIAGEPHVTLFVEPAEAQNGRPKLEVVR